jgi:6-phosphofructokinase
MEASFDVASMCATSTKIFVLEVMGRHAGWIAAAGGLVDDSIPVVSSRVPCSARKRPSAHFVPSETTTVQ